MHAERKIVSIYTNNPEQDIWQYISDYEIEQVVIEYLKNNGIYSKDDNNNSEIDRQKLIIAITNNAKQAREFYMLSKQLPLSSRPVLLHYAFEKLTIMLILLKFGYTRSINHHGITYCNTIEVKEDGLFVKLHEYFSPQTNLKGEQFDLIDLIDANAISRIKIEHNIYKNQEIKITSVKTHKVLSIYELEREFLFSFVLSVLARYQISKWMDILSARKDRSIIKIRRYFESIQLLFPNLILNELYNRTLNFFYPAELGDVEMDEYDIPLDL